MHTCLQLIILQTLFVRSTQATCPFPSSKDDICTSIKEFLNSLISLKAAILENFGIIEKTKDQSSIKIQQGFGYKAKKYCSDIINELKQLYNLSSSNFYEETSLAMEFSHMAALGFEVGDKIVWGCGGSLISDKFVLTAAHCIVDKNLGQVNYVRLGVNRKIEDVENFQVVNVYAHPDYRPPLRYNDIALIELHDSVLSSTYPNVACLNIDRNVNGYDKFNVTGWGLLQNFGESADQVQKVEVDLVSWMECKQHYPADGELKSG
ncbi:PREDICTED: serine protease snake-like isoform X2 [Nicrophorus vespilloides]|nr:PREDICTED: serine protease snake-like isoform X2 [Nicrophorus vespilloides]